MSLLLPQFSLTGGSLLKYSVVIAAVWFLPFAALAQTFGTSVSATAGPGNSVFDNGPYASTIRKEYHITDPTVDAVASTSASLGTLQSFASAHTTWNATSGFQATGASGNAEWHDALTITSGTLALNTPITLAMYLPVTGSLRADAGERGNSFASVASNFGAGDGSSGTTLTFQRNTNGLDQNLGYGELRTFVGATVTLTGSLSAEASVYSAGAELPDITAWSDFSGTAHFYIEPLTPDFSYVSASGQTYFRPVPAPAALLTAFIGMTPGVAILLRRRQK